MSEKPKRRPFTKKDYASFIAQLELQNIWLQELTFRNSLGPVKPGTVPVNVTVLGRWEPEEHGFLGQSRFEISMEPEDDSSEIAIELEAVFNARFKIENIPVEPILDEFTRNNLQIITWPYLRQLLADLMARTGWEAFTLPTLTRF